MAVERGCLGMRVVSLIELPARNDRYQKYGGSEGGAIRGIRNFGSIAPNVPISQRFEADAKGNRGCGKMGNP